MAEAEHLLHRQVNPGWIQDGEFSSQTFKPTPKDENKLSVYDGKQMDAADSFEHYTTVQKLDSAGVASVSTIEVEAVALKWGIDGTPFPQHGQIDFAGLSGNQAKAKARARGWSYQPKAGG